MQLSSISNSLFGTYAKSIRGLAKTSNRLSSGSRVNAEDGAAELGIANKMRQTIGGTNALMTTVETGKAISNLQEASLNCIAEIIERIYELANSAQDPSKTADDLIVLEKETTQLFTEVTSIANNTKYNGTNVFGASAQNIKYGMETTDVINIGGLDTTNLLLVTTHTVTSAADAATLASYVMATDGTNVEVNQMFAVVGSNIGALSRAQDRQNTYVAGMSTAESALRDVDVAQESADFVKKQVLMQQAQAVLAQANNFSQSALSFIK